MIIRSLIVVIVVTIVSLVVTFTRHPWLVVDRKSLTVPATSLVVALAAAVTTSIVQLAHLCTYPILCVAGQGVGSDHGAHAAMIHDRGLDHSLFAT